MNRILKISKYLLSIVLCLMLFGITNVYAESSETIESIQATITIDANGGVPGDSFNSIIVLTEEETYAVSPQEFLFLIYNAELVCTDSFHGTVFSILFGKQFVTRANGEKGQRMESICDLLGIRDRVFRDYDNIPTIEKQIDYSEVYKKLDLLKKESIAYIVENMI